MEMTAYTWGTLGTITGATAATLIIVQYVKVPMDRLWKIPTRLLVYGIALLILLCAQASTAGFALTDTPLIMINAFVVALSSMGAYENTFAKSDQRVDTLV